MELAQENMLRKIKLDRLLLFRQHNFLINNSAYNFVQEIDQYFQSKINLPSDNINVKKMRTNSLVLFFYLWQ